ncbi:hypothetical protein V6N13_064480 [Hibiscus sabdariffa]
MGSMEVGLKELGICSSELGKIMLEAQVACSEAIIWTPQVEGMLATHSNSTKQIDVCFDIQRSDCYSYAKACYGIWEDVVSIPKKNEDFRLLYDTKGRFRLHAITGDETKVCMNYAWTLVCYVSCYYALIFINLSSAKLGLSNLARREFHTSIPTMDAPYATQTL